MNQQIRILIGEDHPIVRNGLVSMIELEPDMMVTGDAKSGEELLALYPSHKPDVVLLDLRLPDMDGITVIKQLIKINPCARVAILTTFSRPEDIYNAFQASAYAYMLKDQPPEEILRMIRTVARNERLIPAAIATKLAGHVARERLTERELTVLEQLSYGKSNQQISDALLVTVGTIKTHINNILVKLNAHDRTQAVIMGVRLGLIHLVEE